MDRLPRRLYTRTGDPVAYALVGTSDRCVVLLHGLGGTADFWQPLVPTLAATYTVICPDLLGFGFSAKPRVAYTPARHAAAVVAVLRELGATRVHAVVGHSVGGVVAIALLAAGVITTHQLVLAATPYPSPRFPLRHELLRSPLDRLMLTWTPLAQVVHHALLRAWPLLAHLPVPPYLGGAWAGYLDHTIQSYTSTTEECLFRADIDPLLAAIATCPTLLLYAINDTTVPLVHGQRLHTTLPQSTLRVIDGDHYAVLRAGRAIVLPWLIGHDTPSSP
jgi:pimeloyl-ACP methyl ester carboxylesterase